MFYLKMFHIAKQNILLPSAVIANAHRMRPAAEFSTSLSPAEFSSQAVACKPQVIKHGYGRNLEVETLSVTDNGALLS